MRLAAIIVVLIFVCVCMAICACFGWHRNQTISKHVATALWSRILFCVVDLAMVATLAAYTWTWLRPETGLAWPICAVFNVALALLAVIGIFPHTTGRSETIHVHCAWAAMIAMAVTSFATTIQLWHATALGIQIYDAIYLAYCLVLIGIAFSKYLQPWYLYWESTYFIGFFALMLLAH